MPRHVDPEVEGRILQAAQKLWHKGGEKALSMRAVAKAAGTNTPAVYRRFRSREELLRSLVDRFRRDLYSVLEPCQTHQEFAQAYLKFALNRPREYEVINSGLLARLNDRPNFDFAARRSADWLGGTPAENRRLIFAIAALAHGTALYIITRTVLDGDVEELKAAFARSVDALVANAEKLRE